jgi:hypothetical protein
LFVGLPFADLIHSTTKKNDGIRGRLARLILGAKAAWLHPRWLGPVHVMDGPGMRGIRWITVKTAISECASGQQSE